MARQEINTGAFLGDRTGDNGRVAFTKVNENFAELYGELDGSNTVPGTTDMTAAITAATLAGPVVFKSGETYYVTPLSFSGVDIDWRADGTEPATIYCDSSPSSSMALFSGASVLNTTVAAAAYPMDLEVQLTSVAGIQVGDLVKFVNTGAVWQSDDRGESFEGQLAKVVAVDGSTVQLDAALAVGMPVGAAARVYRPISVRMRGIRFQRLAINGSSRGVALQWADDPQLENCEFVDASRIGLHLLYCYNGRVKGGGARGANLVVSEQLGYGYLVESCFATQILEGVFKECRRSVDLSGYDDDGIPSWYCRLSGNRAYGGGFAEDGSDLWPLGSEGGSGFGSHGPAVGTVYENNLCVNTFRGFTIRGRDETIRNNLLIGAQSTPIWCQYGGGLLIENNRYTDQYEEQLATPDTSTGAISLTRRPNALVHFIPGDYDQNKHLTVRGNTARNVKNSLIYVDGAVDDTINNWVLDGNTVAVLAGSPTTVGVLGRDDQIIATNFRARNNTIIAPTTYTVVKYRFPTNPAIANAEVFELGDHVYRLWLPDDTAARIRTGTSSGQIGVRLFPSTTNTTPRFNGVIRYESATNVDWGGSSGVTVAAATLAGTTGADGDTSIAYDDDSVYVENRSGGALQMILQLDGAM
jgi:hypothetical protein